MESETRSALIVLYFLYIIGMSAAAITVPDQIDKRWGWVALGGVLGITLILLVVDAVLRYRRKKNPEHTPIYGGAIFNNRAYVLCSRRQRCLIFFRGRSLHWQKGLKMKQNDSRKHL